jgi:hypothetical protein
MSVNTDYSTLGGVLNLQKEINALTEELTCPVTWEPLDSAVILIPCAHRVQQAIAEKLYGQGKQCPECTGLITGYMIDHKTRNICEKVLKISESLNTTIAQLSEKDRLSEKSVTEIKLHSFPRTKFKISDESNSHIRFSANDQGSFFQAIVFLKNKTENRFVAIIHYYKNSEIVQNYLIGCGFSEVSTRPGENTHRICKIDEIKKFIKILKENNEFSYAELEKLYLFLNL